MKNISKSELTKRISKSILKQISENIDVELDLHGEDLNISIHLDQEQIKESAQDYLRKYIGYRLIG